MFDVLAHDYVLIIYVSMVYMETQSLSQSLFIHIAGQFWMNCRYASVCPVRHGSCKQKMVAHKLTEIYTRI